MPVFYNFTQSGLRYSFDDVFVPADLFREGNLWGWGFGGSLANTSSNSVLTPVTTFAGGTNWKQISCDTAIKTDGTLWTWGYNGTGIGKLGNASTVNDVSTPVTTFAGGTNWKQVSGGTVHIAAIKTDGTLWVWGSGGSGRLGNAVTTNVSTPVTTFAGGTNWKQVTAGNNYTAAIKTDGTLWVWGSGNNGKLGNNLTTNASTPVTTFAGGSNWKQVSASNSHTAAIKTDGTLWVWGAGGSGRLGNNLTSNVSTPVTTFAGGTNWKQVSCGILNHTAAIKTDGTLWVWGSGDFSKLGNNSTSNRSTPVTTFAGGTNWKQVACGEEHTVAIKTDGTLWNWGRNFNGQLGINSTASNASTPVTTFAGGSNWKQVADGLAAHTAALTYIDPVI